MTNKLSELTFEEFSELVDFLKELGRKKLKKDIIGKHELNEFVCSTLNRFFPELTAVQEIALVHLIENFNETEFNLFKNEYPDIYIDNTGKGKPKEKKYWEVTLESLKQLYNFSLNSNTPFGIQTINAMDLTCLLEKRYYGYVASRKLFLEKFRNVLPDSFVIIEAFFKEYFGNEKASIILGQVTGYALSEKSKSKFEMFVDHFIRRSECLLMEYKSSNSIKNEENVKFLKNIEKLLQQYFIK